MRFRTFLLFMVIAVIALVAAACSEKDATVNTPGDTGEPFEWVVISDIDPAALGLDNENVELFHPRRDQVMLADSVAVEEIVRKHPDFGQNRDRYFRQFIGILDDQSPAILVNYILPGGITTAGDARSAMEYWYQALPSTDNPPESWIQVRVELQTLEPIVTYEHL